MPIKVEVVSKDNETPTMVALLRRGESFSEQIEIGSHDSYIVTRGDDPTKSFKITGTYSLYVHYTWIVLGTNAITATRPSGMQIIESYVRIGAFFLDNQENLQVLFSAQLSTSNYEIPQPMLLNGGHFGIFYFIF